MRTIFHIDANSAYLSWTASHMLQQGSSLDIRTVPSAIAGDPMARNGIILAKSMPAKRYHIHTGEALFEARQKCPQLMVYPPDYDLYMDCSDAMYEILSDYSPNLQRYSIDECFLDYSLSSTAAGQMTPKACAHQIKERIKRELGYTVNIGIGPNKLLAKMAGELKKPDMVHTIWSDEISQKMWPLPVEDLFMVGRATTKKLQQIGIRTIGDLALTDPVHLQALLHKHGRRIYDYANGVDDSPVIRNAEIPQKGVGNSITTPTDLMHSKEALRVLLALTERVGLRLRKLGCAASLVSVSIRTNTFFRQSHQKKTLYPTDATSELYRIVCGLFNEMWKKDPLRHLGVSVSDLLPKDELQLSLFQEDIDKTERFDQTVDAIRRRYGDTAVFRGTFTNTSDSPLLGGTNDGDYIMMGGYQL